MDEMNNQNQPQPVGQPQYAPAPQMMQPAAPMQPATPPVAPVMQPQQPTSLPKDPNLQEAADIQAKLLGSYSKVIIGQTDVLESILVTLISQGHLLIEGVPGLAKTTAVATIAKTLGANFVRIQCTPDMLPSDIIGTQIYNQQSHEFVTKIGPINHQFVLVDEVNRTSAKTQSAMLEAMQERQVSIGGETHKLPDQFIVLATQNPIEQEGTYQLPEAQLDRFLMKHIISYPTLEEEVMVMKVHNSSGKIPEIEQSLNIGDIAKLQAMAREITIDDKVLNYIATVVAATRNPAQYGLSGIVPYLEYGASPRASLALAACGRAAALLAQNNYVTPDHIKPFLSRVLRHRIGLTYEADAEGVTSDQIIENIGASVIVP